MATEKTILTVDLYDNVLTEKQGDYSGKIRITGTVRNADIANGIVKERTEYRPETIENILNLADKKKREALASANIFCKLEVPLQAKNLNISQKRIKLVFRLLPVLLCWKHWTLFMSMPILLP